jgi:exodeoxyribonuclease III
MRLATWNVNSVTARLPRLLDWLGSAAPDVLCLQETKTPAFPAEEIEKLGYQVVAHGVDRWNGVALLSRVGVEDVTMGFPGAPGFPDPAATPEPRAVGATCDGVRVWSVYVPNGRTPDSDHYAYKLAWLEALRTALEPELATHAQLAVCGDFNVAPTDADVWDPAAFVGATHVTDAERAALTALRGLGLVDVLPRSLKGPNPFTYHDYRGGYFHKDMGMRIDLVYASQPLADRVSDAYIDREARKGKGPSDHAPVVLDLRD